MPKLLTPSMIARELDVTERWVTELLNRGELKGERIGRNWFIEPEDFERYKRTREQSSKSNPK